MGANASAGWRHEAEVMARVCDHRNIVQLHEVFEDTNYVYIVMEPCLGARTRGQWRTRICAFQRILLRASVRGHAILCTPS